MLLLFLLTSSSCCCYYYYFDMLLLLLLLWWWLVSGSFLIKGIYYYYFFWLIFFLVSFCEIASSCDFDFYPFLSSSVTFQVFSRYIFKNFSQNIICWVKEKTPSGTMLDKSHTKCHKIQQWQVYLQLDLRHSKILL